MRGVPAVRSRPVPSGRWQVRYRDDEGAQSNRSLDTARDARALLDDTRSAVRAGPYVDPEAGRKRFAAFAQQWVLDRLLAPLAAQAL